MLPSDSIYPIDFLIKKLVHTALEEDLGRRGDVTSSILYESGSFPQFIQGHILAREEGYIFGLACVRLAFKILDPQIRIEFFKKDGEHVQCGEKIAHCEGNALSILSAERVALNFLGHLSGIATQTRAFITAIQGEKAKVCATRKTTPGLRFLEKEAVRAGGGLPHRFGLDDAILIKDNHIKAAGGVTFALEAIKKASGPMLVVQLEVDTFSQLQEAMPLNVQAILLDNMSPADLKKCVDYVDGRVILEASGNIRLNNILPIAQSGVDLISCGSLTHSSTRLDVALDIL